MLLFVIVFGGLTVLSLGVALSGGVQGSLFGDASCEWQPVANGTYSSLNEFQNDFEGDFSELKTQVNFRVDGGVLEYKLQDETRCRSLGKQGG